MRILLVEDNGDTRIPSGNVVARRKRCGHGRFRPAQTFANDSLKRFLTKIDENVDGHGINAHTCTSPDHG